MAGTVITVHTVDRPGNTRTINDATKCHGDLAPGLPGLLLLSGLDGRVDTGLGGSEIGLRCNICTLF